MKTKETVGLHIRLPKHLYDQLLARRDRLRKTRAMASLSEAVRDVLERGLQEKR